MTDQELARVLLPAVVVAPPLVGLFVGLRGTAAERNAIERLRSAGRVALVTWLVTVGVGLLAGAVWAAAVDLKAASMPGGNPWIGHPAGISLVNCGLGALVSGVMSAVTGLVSGAVVWWRYRKLRSHEA